MRNKFILAMLLISSLIGFSQSQIDPTTQIYWAASSGSGAPPSLTCSTNYSEQYYDYVNNVTYICGISGWQLFTAGLSTHALNLPADFALQSAASPNAGSFTNLNTSQFNSGIIPTDAMLIGLNGLKQFVAPPTSGTGLVVLNAGAAINNPVINGGNLPASSPVVGLNALSQFIAPPTTGSGSVVFSNSPTFTGLASFSTVAANTAVIAPNLTHSSFGYTFYQSGGTYYARNNATAQIDYSNADAGVVIRSAIANNIGTCGHLYFAAGIYNINSLVQETASGYTNDYYAIAPPVNAGTNQYCTWILEGDTPPPLIDELGATSPNTGVIIYVTPTAVSSVSSDNVIVGVWAKPGTLSSVTLKNIGIRFPDNQRGNEWASNLTNALNAEYDHVLADTNVTQTSLQYPVAGTYGMIGLTSTLAAHEENKFENAFVMGYDVGLDIESEHTVLLNSGAVDGNHCVDYGVRGIQNQLYHASTFIGVICGETSRALTLGSFLMPATLLDIWGLDIEDATPTGATWQLPFVTVYHAKETTPLSSYGHISYSYWTNAPSGLRSTSPLFDGGGGQLFILNDGDPQGLIKDLGTATTYTLTLQDATLPTFKPVTVFAEGAVGAIVSFPPVGVISLPNTRYTICNDSSSGVVTMAGASNATGNTTIDPGSCKVFLLSYTLNSNWWPIGSATTAAPTSITIGTTPVNGGAVGQVLFNNGGILDNLPTSGTGSVVLNGGAAINNPVINGGNLPASSPVVGLNSLSQFVAPPTTGSGSVVFSANPVFTGLASFNQLNVSGNIAGLSYQATTGGSIAAPTYSWAGYQSSGMFVNSVGEVGLSVNSAGIFSVLSSGIQVNGDIGNGIGSTLFPANALSWTGANGGHPSLVPGAEAFGNVTLVGGSASVSTTAACTPSATCVYKLTNCGASGSVIIGVLSVASPVPGTSFAVNSLSSANTVVNDTSNVCWQIN